MTTPVHRRPPVLVMETGANQVPGGAQAGWVSGDPAGLAASTAIYMVFDLGPDWDQYAVASLGYYNMALSAGGGSAAYGADDPLTRKARLLSAFPSANTNLASFSDLGSGSYSDKIVGVRLSGRYVIVQITNGATAQPANCTLRVTAYPS